MSYFRREDIRSGTGPLICIVNHDNDDDDDDDGDRDSVFSQPDEEFIPALEDLVTPISLRWHLRGAYPSEPWRYDARVWLQRVNGRPATQADGERYLAGCLQASILRPRRGGLLFVLDLSSQQQAENGGSDRILRGPWFTEHAVGNEMELAISLTIVPTWGDVEDSVRVHTGWDLDLHRDYSTMGLRGWTG